MTEKVKCSCMEMTSDYMTKLVQVATGDWGDLVMSYSREYPMDELMDAMIEAGCLGEFSRKYKDEIMARQKRVSEHRGTWHTGLPLPANVLEDMWHLSNLIKHANRCVPPP